MNLPCSVINDLLPLYAENLTSEDTSKLIEEHLAECADCRARLEALKQPEATEPESTAPIKNLKKEIRRRRLLAVGIAALAVYIVLFTVLVHVTDRKPVAYREGMLQVDGVYPYGWTELYKPEYAQGVFVIKAEDAGTLEVDYSEDPDTGEITALLQCWENGINGSISHEETLLLKEGTVRVIYGFGPDQVLLWGEPMNGGIQVLPRLALTFYLVMAVIGAILFAVLWIIFRKKKAGGIFRQICFAPIGYIVGHLLVKGVSSSSYFLVRDFAAILIAGAAVYALLSLIYLAVRRRKTA